ncbi:hypothetical protein ACFSKM_18715 [Ancylobacter dichloromethanicus]
MLITGGQVLQIKDVRVSVHRFKNMVPLINKPIEDDYRIICEIETDEGHVGIGMASRFLWHGVAAIVEKASRSGDPRHGPT